MQPFLLVHKRHLRFDSKNSVCVGMTFFSLKVLLINNYTDMHQCLAVLRGRVKRYALVMSCTSIIIIFGFKSLINLFLIENIILIDVKTLLVLDVSI